MLPKEKRMKKIYWIFLIALSLAGCATSSMYMPYTDQVAPAKPKNYFITVYSVSQPPPLAKPYRVVGKVEVRGYASDGVSPDQLMEQAKNIARKKGADAIINANTQMLPYRGSYIVSGHRGYYHHVRYIPYEDTLLEFTGELIIYMSEK